MSAELQLKIPTVIPSTRGAGSHVEAILSPRRPAPLFEEPS